MNASTILLVDDDEVLSQVLRRVLTRQGYTVLTANNVAQAEQLAEQHHPQLALLDLCLPDGDGVELARRLTEKSEKLPLILLTAYPLRLRDRPELASHFSRVLTKPVNLQELRDAIESALHEPMTATAQVALPSDASAQPRQEPAMSAVVPPAPVVPSAPLLSTSTGPRSSRRLWSIAAVSGVAACVLLLLLVGWSNGWYRVLAGKPNSGANSEEDSGPVSRVPSDPNAIGLTEEVVNRLKIGTEPIKPSTPYRVLELPGTLGFDNDKQSRLRSRFAGELVQIMPPSDQALMERDANGKTDPERKWRNYDRVHKDDVLAIVWSADFGQKKSDLVDALSQLAADEAFLKRYDTLDRSGLIPEFTILQQRRNAEQSRIMVQRAENSLRTAKMTDEEIKALEDKLKDIAAKPLTPQDRSKLEGWARVEVKAPFDGWIVEKNQNPGDIIDTSTDLFKIVDLRRMMVWANVREEDLPTLLDKKLPIPWEVHLPNDPNAKPLAGQIVYVTPQIDPTQHVALAMGYVENTDQRLRAVQFVTATVQIDDPEKTVTIPTAALIEDGDTSIVFVQPNPDKYEYVMKRVRVAKRYNDVVHISNDLTMKDAGPFLLKKSTLAFLPAAGLPDETMEKLRKNIAVPDEAAAKLLEGGADAKHGIFETQGAFVAALEKTLNKDELERYQTILVNYARQGLQPLEPGERVVIQNALGMKAALDDLQSKKP